MNREAAEAAENRESLMSKGSLLSNNGSRFPMPELKHLSSANSLSTISISTAQSSSESPGGSSGSVSSEPTGKMSSFVSSALSALGIDQAAQPTPQRRHTVDGLIQDNSQLTEDDPVSSQWPNFTRSGSLSRVDDHPNHLGSDLSSLQRHAFPSMSFASLTLPPIAPSPPVGSPTGYSQRSPSENYALSLSGMSEFHAVSQAPLPQSQHNHQLRQPQLPSDRSPKEMSSSFPKSHLSSHLRGDSSYLMSSQISSANKTSDLPSAMHEDSPSFAEEFNSGTRGFQHILSEERSSAITPPTSTSSNGPAPATIFTPPAVHPYRSSAEKIFSQLGERMPTGLSDSGSTVGLEVATSDTSTPRSDATSKRLHSIEDILPRDAAIYIISLFFDYVWPLTPCLHQPTFIADLSARREERDSLFFALVMSTLAATLVQVPKVYVPVENSQVRGLAGRCQKASRAITINAYDPPTFLMVIIRYFDCVYHFVIGKPGANTASFAEALDIAVSLGLHRRESYIDLDPIEDELRRRIYWLLFVADKSMACLIDRIITIQIENISTPLPTEIDDEFITRQAYLPQPSTRTPIIVGFNLATKIFALLGSILQAQRETKRHPPVGAEEVLHKLRVVASFISDMASVLRDIPTAFVQQDSFDSAANSPCHGWEEEAKTQLTLFFSDPTSSRENAKDAFLVSQGNIYVTQALVRFVLIQYRDELLDMSGAIGSPSRKAAELVIQERAGAFDRREAVAVDLLNALHRIPIQSLAVNGPSLVQKVRFVASTLLEIDADTTMNKSEPISGRLNAYLWDFLSVLSEIEKNFSE
ncbi:quinate utilization pathway activator [Phaffia rhodozyma]|uniref:Quinate utilization pathway activator n=1 Tax=Phaffia rhodozyma TaxID=264483 RepID=A0A0F7STK9_PHARH|nr:quinate utilization pathway activator [Phaffia rhodozyma]